MIEEKPIHVLVVAPFIDIVTGDYRYAGDEIDVTRERMEQINNAGHGKLVVAYNDKSYTKFKRANS
ncbi:hypothetical protein [Atopobium fossor]|uniref:hypothetical protein n=1 Tax=Atopobium fossor TaxID=39487 RepID=UPI0003FF82B0|nr:hypothetical protein [Atopobium fossor]